MSPTVDRGWSNWLPPPRRQRFDPFLSLFAESESRGCGCEEGRRFVDAFLFNKFPQLAARDSARWTDTKRHHATRSRFAPGDINVKSPECIGFWIPQLCEST